MDLMQYEALVICAMAAILIVFAWELICMDEQLRQKDYELEYYRAKTKEKWPSIKPDEENNHHSYAA